MNTTKFSSLLILLFMIFSCKNEEQIDHLLKAPVLIQPEVGSVTEIDSVLFKWEVSTALEDDKISYTLLVSTDSTQWAKCITKVTQGCEIKLNLEKGLKYYWKVKSENYSNNIQTGEGAESLSSASCFYTTPRGVSNLNDFTGNGYINLYWDDPDDIDYVEVTFEPMVNTIIQPIKVKGGTEKIELEGFENGSIYSFYFSVHNKLGHISAFDTIKAMPLLPNQVHDVDFNIYTTVKIGGQTWLRENLKSTRYQDGSSFVYGSGELIPLSSLKGSKSDVYGLYYNSIIASGGYNQDKNPCPRGYHVPSDDEWKILESYLGMTNVDVNSDDYSVYRGENEKVGKILKSETGWLDFEGNDGDGSDLYGFKLLPAGYINDKGFESKIGALSLYWTNTGDGVINKCRIFSNSSDGIKRGQSGPVLKASIRCIKD